MIKSLKEYAINFSIDGEKYYISRITDSYYDSIRRKKFVVYLTKKEKSSLKWRTLEGVNNKLDLIKKKKQVFIQHERNKLDYSGKDIKIEIVDASFNFRKLKLSKINNL